MSFWKKSLWKTNPWQKILLKLTHWQESLGERILWQWTLWKRKSPQQMRALELSAAERLQEVLPSAPGNYRDVPEGYVPVMPVEHIPLPPSPAPISVDLQVESSDSQPESVEPQFEAAYLQSEAVELKFESGGLQVESCDPQFEAVDSQPEADDWQVETSESQPEAGDWQFESAESLLEPDASQPESVDSQPDDEARLADEMAANFFGFGDWAAPYWFIGLEPGKAPGEEADNSRILHAWGNGLKKGELVDCLEFHRAIGVDDWHKERAKLQPTWRPLMLFLMTALDRDSDREALRDYQRTRWGQTGDGETCVIDLSGIQANGHAEEEDRKEHLAQRIGAIRRKMMMGDTSPKVVVLHGLSARSEWEEIVGVPLEPDTVVEVGSTLFVMTPSPTAYRRKNADWEKLGVQVRERLYAHAATRYSETIP